MATSEKKISLHGNCPVLISFTCRKKCHSLNFYFISTFKSNNMLQYNLLQNAIMLQLELPKWCNRKAFTRSPQDPSHLLPAVKGAKILSCQSQYAKDGRYFPVNLMLM